MYASQSAKLYETRTAAAELIRRWLQDTSQENSPIFLFFFAPPPLPVSPGSPEVDPMIDQNRRSRIKKSS